MPRAAIRAAVQKYLQTGGISFVGAVYPARPYRIPAGAFMGQEDAKYAATVAVPGQTSGAVIVCHFPDDLENRVAVGGATGGEKFNVHRLVLELLFNDTSGDGIVAAQNHDAFIDSLMKRLRADRVLGAPGVIWQSGQDKPTGYHLQLAKPRTVKASFVQNGSLTMNVWEYVFG